MKIPCDLYIPNIITICQTKQKLPKKKTNKVFVSEICLRGVWINGYCLQLHPEGMFKGNTYNGQLTLSDFLIFVNLVRFFPSYGSIYACIQNSTNVEETCSYFQTKSFAPHSDYYLNIQIDDNPSNKFTLLSALPMPVNPKCNYTMFMCKEGSCIASSYVCDGNNDCLDGEDEINCKGMVFHFVLNKIVRW